MQELLPRVESGTETENNAYVHGWTVVEQCRSNCRGAIVEARVVVQGRTVYGPKDGVHLSGEYKLSGLMPV